MKIDFYGVSINSLQDYLSEQTEKFRKVFGSEFYIKPEGVIDNIITSMSLSKFLLLHQIAFYIKQISADTAEAEYQDAIFERIGLYRLPSSFTTFKKTIFGIPNTVIPANTLTLSQAITKEEFTNITEIFIDDSGKGTAQFKAEISGEIIVNKNDNFEIIRNTSGGLISLCHEEAFDIETGNEEESDSEFRERFWNAQDTEAKCTRNALIQSLWKYVQHPQYLKVIDGNSDISIDAGKILIIAKPSVSDMDFAKVVLKNTLCGIKFLGNISVDVPLSNGMSREVKFQKAADIPLELNAVIKIKHGYYENSTVAEVCEKILEYIPVRAFGLGSTIYATEFILPILEVDGVEAVTSISVKKSSDAEYTANVELERDELPLFSREAITLTLT